jgi:hypothetical protein
MGRRPSQADRRKYRAHTERNGAARLPDAADGDEAKRMPASDRHTGGAGHRARARLDVRNESIEIG